MMTTSHSKPTLHGWHKVFLNDLPHQEIWWIEQGVVVDDYTVESFEALGYRFEPMIVLTQAEHAALTQTAPISESVWAATAPYSDWSNLEGWAEWLTIDNRGEVLQWEYEPYPHSDRWADNEIGYRAGHCEYVMPDAMPVEIPVGVDWRTLKRQRLNSQETPDANT